MNNKTKGQIINVLYYKKNNTINSQNMTKRLTENN